MSSPLVYARWARELRMSEWGLKRSHGSLIRLMADYVDGQGHVQVGAKTLAATLEVSREYVHALQRDIAKKGLARKVRRGGGARAAVWRLCMDARPVTQLRLGDEVTVNSEFTVPSSQSEKNCEAQTVKTVNSGVHKKSLEENNNDESARGQASNGAIATTLDMVVEVLRPLIAAIEVYEPSLNSTLLRFPEARGYDHAAAAHGVAAYVQQPGVTGPHNPVGLLSKEFEFQARRQARAAEDAERRDREHAARRDAGRPPLHALPGGLDRAGADAPIEEIDEAAIYARSAAAVAGVTEPWRDAAS